LKKKKEKHTSSKANGIYPALANASLGTGETRPTESVTSSNNLNASFSSFSTPLKI
jgi:hypothetical protein